MAAFYIFLHLLVYLRRECEAAGRAGRGGGARLKNGFVISYSKLDAFLLPYFSRSWEGQQELCMKKHFCC